MSARTKKKTNTEMDENIRVLAETMIRFYPIVYDALYVTMYPTPPTTPYDADLSGHIRSYVAECVCKVLGLGENNLQDENVQEQTTNVMIALDHGFSKNQSAYVWFVLTGMLAFDPAAWNDEKRQHVLTLDIVLRCAMRFCINIRGQRPAYFKDESFQRFIAPLGEDGDNDAWVLWERLQRKGIAQAVDARVIGGPAVDGLVSNVGTRVNLQPLEMYMNESGLLTDLATLASAIEELRKWYDAAKQIAKVDGRRDKAALKEQQVAVVRKMADPEDGPRLGDKRKLLTVWYGDTAAGFVNKMEDVKFALDESYTRNVMPYVQKDTLHGDSGEYVRFPFHEYVTHPFHMYTEPLLAVARLCGSGVLTNSTRVAMERVLRVLTEEEMWEKDLMKEVDKEYGRNRKSSQFRKLLKTWGGEEETRKMTFPKDGETLCTEVMMSRCWAVMAAYARAWSGQNERFSKVLTALYEGWGTSIETQNPTRNPEVKPNEFKTIVESLVFTSEMAGEDVRRFLLLDEQPTNDVARQKGPPQAKTEIPTREDVEEWTRWYEEYGWPFTMEFRAMLYKTLQRSATGGGGEIGRSLDENVRATMNHGVFLVTAEFVASLLRDEDGMEGCNISPGDDVSTSSNDRGRDVVVAVVRELLLHCGKDDPEFVVDVLCAYLSRYKSGKCKEEFKKVIQPLVRTLRVLDSSYVESKKGGMKREDVSATLNLDVMSMRLRVRARLSAAVLLAGTNA